MSPNGFCGLVTFTCVATVFVRSLESLRAPAFWSALGGTSDFDAVRMDVDVPEWEYIKNMIKRKPTTRTTRRGVSIVAGAVSLKLWILCVLLSSAVLNHSYRPCFAVLT